MSPVEQFVPIVVDQKTAARGYFLCVIGILLFEGLYTLLSRLPYLRKPKSMLCEFIIHMDMPAEKLLRTNPYSRCHHPERGHSFQSCSLFAQV